MPSSVLIGKVQKAPLHLTYTAVPSADQAFTIAISIGTLRISINRNNKPSILYPSLKRNRELFILHHKGQRLALSIAQQSSIT